MKLASKPKRILDFDIENRPLTYLGGDFTTGDITAIAWAWTDDPENIECRLIHYSEDTQLAMLTDFLAAYKAADIVTGHYIRGHDLPVINGALLEWRMEPLPEKLTSDTKLDLVRRKYVSASQESLGGMLGLDAPKVHMDQTKWRSSNRLEDEGLDYTYERVVGDVRQHMQLRLKLLELGWLGPPKRWGGASSSTGYTP